VLPPAAQRAATGAKGGSMINTLVPVGTLTDDEVHSVIAAAAAAPSLHNSQPWRFRCTPTTIELRADLRRALPAADPDHREIMLACGAALFNLRLAIRALSVASDVRVLPDPHSQDLLAVVRPEGFVHPSPADLRLAAAIFNRHTNRRPFTDDPVPERVTSMLRQAARTELAWMATVPPEQQSELHRLLARAHRTQQDNPLFVDEWNRWTRRDDGSTDGVPLRSAGVPPEQQDLWVMRNFSDDDSAPRTAGKDFESDPLIAVIGSFGDTRMGQLQAGQAMQRVLLAGTVEGISASFLSQVIEVPETRRALRTLIGGAVWPQVVLRMGYGSPATTTPRRPLEEVVDDSGSISTS
jgi:nitroreductase